MFSEMFPPTVALHHGLKAVYAPHPTYFDRAWQPLGSSIDAAFNSGKHHSVSGKNSPYDLDNEHNHKGTTWYYHSEFAGLLWRRWLGYSQLDGRGDAGGRGGSGTERGGVSEESSAGSSGRMCLRSMLMHPIKHEHPSEESN
ncbi:Major facilitator superfamily transporter [Ophiocordyceps sinensis CO18]|nr:Major facilitator superfamily transporter [Ophiocordyceps sinensis CO18]